jgi:prepilin-type processing-associated H-X9-DG protein
LTAHEMARASDADLLRLFDELPDETEWDNPKQRWSKGFSRGGGAIQLSHEFRQLARQAPARVIGLSHRFRPRRHEHYAGAAVEGLAETEMQTSELISLIDTLDQRGFSSGAFRNAVALALERRGKRDRGLPDAILLRLAGWLVNHADPPPTTKQDEKQQNDEHSGGPVLFADGSVSVPPDRGYIMQALAAGYLARQTPDLENWARVIESRLAHERHPAVWAMTLRYMPMLFNGDRQRATSLYDAVIRCCPAVLTHAVALLAIAHVIGRVKPKARVQDWLEKLRVEDAAICRQAYGELLVLCYHYHRDSWSDSQIRQHLAESNNVTILRGLAYAASYLWRNRDCQPIATEILCRLAVYNEVSIQRAVAAVFRVNQENLDLNLDMRRVIEAACTAPPILLEASLSLVEILVPYTGIEPALVAKVCQEVLKAAGPRISRIADSLSMLAETVTNIALTLHRQVGYREVGLALFEQLLTLNVQEARYALEILDRNPIQATPLVSRRRRRPRSRPR